MADRRDWIIRQELHHIYHWCRLPVKKPGEAITKQAVLDFLDGIDPFIRLDELGVPRFQSTLFVDRARIFLGNERGKRRRKAKEILAFRSKNSRTFTSGNLRVTIDAAQDRNYGMTTTSIYCIVEVWTAKEEEPEKEHLVHFSDYKTKEWLVKLLVWALMNDREVVIKPATQAQMESMRLFTPRDKVA